MNSSSDLLTRPFGRSLVGAPTGDESADFDRFAIQDLGVPQATLMENAGRSAAMVLQKLYPTGPVTAMVGTGNNGGDALVLLRNLAAWGRPVSAILVGERRGDETSSTAGGCGSSRTRICRGILRASTGSWPGHG